MQVEISGQTLELIQKQVARDGLASPEEAIEKAVRFYEDCHPTTESFHAKLLEAHRQFEAGEISPLSADDIKHRGRKRLAQHRTD